MQNLYVLNFKWFAQKETSNSTRSQACRLSNKSIDFLTLLFVYLAEAPTGVSWVPPESHLNQRLGHRSAIYWLGRGSGEVPNAWNTDTCLFVSSLILRLFNVTRQDVNSDYCSLSWTHFVPLNGAAYSLFTRILFWGYAHALSLSGLDSWAVSTFWLQVACQVTVLNLDDLERRLSWRVGLGQCCDASLLRTRFLFL